MVSPFFANGYDMLHLQPVCSNGLVIKYGKWGGSTKWEICRSETCCVPQPQDRVKLTHPPPPPPPNFFFFYKRGPLQYGFILSSCVKTTKKKQPSVWLNPFLQPPFFVRIKLNLPAPLSVLKAPPPPPLPVINDWSLTEPSAENDIVNLAQVVVSEYSPELHRPIFVMSVRSGPWYIFCSFQTSIYDSYSENVCFFTHIMHEIRYHQVQLV